MDSESRARRTDLVVLLLALEVGALLRLLPVALNAFPLNDGGLFYRMTLDLIANGLRLPEMTSYNGGAIPYAYPPLGMYLGAGIHLATGIPLLELMRWLPGLFSVLTIPAVYWLGRRILPGGHAAALAALLFAMIPRSFEWMVMGGGLARSPGMLLAILSLLQGLRLLERGTWPRVAGLGVLVALTALLHLEMAWFTAFSLVLFTALLGRRRANTARLAAALALGAVLAGVWWMPVMVRHGTAPFVQAFLTGGHNESTLAAALTNLTGEPLVGVFLVLGILGIIVALVRRQPLLPLWLAATLLLDPRAAGTDASIPIAMLAALAILGMIFPALGSPGGEPAPSRDLIPPAAAGSAHPKAARLMVTASLLVYGVVGGLLAPFLPLSPLRALRPGELAGLEWMEVALPGASTVLVVSGREAWESDSLAEWLPALTDHVSPMTPQGTEWIGTLADTAADRRSLQVCARRGLACLDRWREETGVPADYILVAQYGEGAAIQSVALVEGMRASAEYGLIFENPDVALFAVGYVD